MKIRVVVPFRSGGCPHRERAWRWVRKRYASIFPEWELVEASPPEGPWSKGAAVTPAVEAGSAEVIVVADADVWCDDLRRAIYAIICGQAVWAVPHKEVLRLNEGGTRAFLSGEAPERRDFTEKYEGLWGGGIVAMRREIYLDCPIDPRFLGWGQEDTSWARALQCLHGDGWRGHAPLIHLWHPPSVRLDRQKGSKAGWQLFLRYHKASSKPEAMRALLEEARCPSLA